jgi:hypothetical protein
VDDRCGIEVKLEPPGRSFGAALFYAMNTDMGRHYVLIRVTRIHAMARQVGMAGHQYANELMLLGAALTDDYRFLRVPLRISHERARLARSLSIPISPSVGGAFAGGGIFPPPEI